LLPHPFPTADAPLFFNSLPRPPLASCTADNNPPIKGLPGLLAKSIGREIEEIYAGNNKGVLADVQLLQEITEACRNAVRYFVQDRTGL
jgi:magnesium chelatase subunit H